MVDTYGTFVGMEFPDPKFLRFPVSHLPVSRDPDPQTGRQPRAFKRLLNPLINRPLYRRLFRPTSPIRRRRSPRQSAFCQRGNRKQLARQPREVVPVGPENYGFGSTVPGEILAWNRINLAGWSEVLWGRTREIVLER